LEVGPTTEDYSHNGALPGLGTYFAHQASGYSFAILANTQANDLDRFLQELSATMVAALDAGITGSPTDLYPQFPSPTLPARTP
jgi:hypothetical protein